MYMYIYIYIHMYVYMHMKGGEIRRRAAHGGREHRPCPRTLPVARPSALIGPTTRIRGLGFKVK